MLALLKIVLAFPMMVGRLLFRVAVASAVLGILLWGWGGYRYFFVLERGEDGKPILPESTGFRPRPPAYDRDAALRQLDERADLRRRMWEAHLERMAAKGASDERLAAEREAAERSMAENDAALRLLEARRARRILGGAAVDPEPGPVEQLRSEIERRRAKRAASWASWLEGFEGENLALERAFVERREAEDRAREDRELAELEQTMRRRGLQSGP